MIIRQDFFGYFQMTHRDKWLQQKRLPINVIGFHMTLEILKAFLVRAGLGVWMVLFCLAGFLQLIDIMVWRKHVQGWTLWGILACFVCSMAISGQILFVLCIPAVDPSRTSKIILMMLFICLIICVSSVLWLTKTQLLLDIPVARLKNFTALAVGCVILDIGLILFNALGIILHEWPGVGLLFGIPYREQKTIVSNIELCQEWVIDGYSLAKLACPLVSLFGHVFRIQPRSSCSKN